VIAYAPIPPARPSALALSNPIPAAVAPELRGLTSAVASLEAVPPLPPARPTSITVASASPLDMPITGSTSSTRVPAHEERPRSASPVVTPKLAEATKVKAPAAPALMTAAPSLAMGFSQKPMGDLATNRFTGPAVKPLPVLR
jgi:hypothetical protein